MKSVGFIKKGFKTLIWRKQLGYELCLTVLIEDSVEPEGESKRQLTAKHGLSILVEAKVGDV